MKDILDLRTWTFMRALRLVMGVWVLVSSINTKQYFVATFGVLFIYQALMNVGCACGVPPQSSMSKKPSTDTDEVTYEEVK